MRLLILSPNFVINTSTSNDTIYCSIEINSLHNNDSIRSYLLWYDFNEKIFIELGFKENVNNYKIEIKNCSDKRNNTVKYKSEPSFFNISAIHYANSCLSDNNSSSTSNNSMVLKTLKTNDESPYNDSSNLIEVSKIDVYLSSLNESSTTNVTSTYKRIVDSKHINERSFMQANERLKYTVLFFLIFIILRFIRIFQKY
jgi:hypothetical protein